MNRRSIQLRHPRFAGFGIALVATTTTLMQFTPFELALALGFDISALIFIASAVPLWRGGPPARIRSSAARDDAGRTALLATTAVVTVSTLGAVASIAARKGVATVAEIALVTATLALVWTFANLVYAFHYAHLFYDRRAEGGDRGGLSFPGESEARFSDFCYFAFVLGMTFQVSDVEITDTDIRKVATIHGIAAFMFNIGVLALTVNVLAGTL